MTKTELDRDLTRRCIVERWALLAQSGNKVVPASCPLCVEYGGRDDECGGCPIKIKTGLVQCHGTPYVLWRHDPTADNARAECDWLWALYDELTEKMLAERAVNGAKNGRLSRISCDACGKTPTVIYRMKHENVCDKCYRVRYDPTAEDGHYLVPVVRGGPWVSGGGIWEQWRDGHFCMSAEHYRVHNGRLEFDYCQREWLPTCVLPDLLAGLELRAPKDYTGPLPEGCRWAEGSEPKPYKVLEGSMDGKLWFEITRTDVMDSYLCTDTKLLHSTRVRTVEASGKTTWTDETCHMPPKPRPKADAIPGLGPLIETPDENEAVAELREHVRTLAQILRASWGGYTNWGALEALLDRLDGDKGEWRGGLAWE